MGKRTLSQKYPFWSPPNQILLLFFCSNIHPSSLQPKRMVQFCAYLVFPPFSLTQVWVSAIKPDSNSLTFPQKVETNLILALFQKIRNKIVIGLTYIIPHNRLYWFLSHFNKIPCKCNISHYFVEFILEVFIKKFDTNDTCFTGNARNSSNSVRMLPIYFIFY